MSRACPTVSRACPTMLRACPIVSRTCPTVSRTFLTVSCACPTVSQRLHGLVVACPTTQPNSQTSTYHNTIVCIVTRLANQIARLSRYKDCIVTQPPVAKPSLLSRYKTLYRDTHPQWPGPRACAACPCTWAGRIVGYIVAQPAISWPSDGRIVAQARPCLGRVMAPWLRSGHASPALCHDTIHCIVTQMCSRPFPVSFLRIFFFTPFFFLIPATGKPPKKNIFFFSFSSKPNKFIKIYFIHFFSSFTHCKTLEKKKFSSHHLFFFH